MKAASIRRRSADAPFVVLVVEDDESNREMYSMYLEMAGLSVLGARNGFDGLKIARQRRPHVVITDVSMPGMDGWQFAHELRQDERTAHAVVVAVSGWSGDAAIAPQGQRQDVDAVLTKPCLPEELLNEIRKLLAHSRLKGVRASRHLARVRRLRSRQDDGSKRASRHRRA